MVFCYNPHGKQCVKKKTDIKTVSKPQVILDGSVAYFLERSRQINHLNVIVSSGKNDHIKFVYSKNTEKDIPETTSCFTCWGSTYQIVCKCSGVYSLMEHGKLDFGLRFSQDINSFYSAISYRPPYGYVSGQKKTFKECVALAQPLLETLDLMKSERIEKYPSRKQLYGYQGAVFGDTIRCIEDTVSTWEVNIKRLEFLISDSVDKVDPHAFTNENLIEHSFGFTKLQGQTQLQSLKEYLYNKLKHEIDFQLKLCNVNFCQKVKVKLRDKSYQHIDEEQKSVLDPHDLWEILGLGQKRTNEDSVELDPKDAKILQHAYLVTKAVPRQSNRAKWKDQSGYGPTMPTVDGAYIDKEDLVFCVDPFNTLKKLLVMEKVEIKANSIVVVSELEVEGSGAQTKPTKLSNLQSVPLSSLLMDKGLVFVIPSGMFRIQGVHVELSDIASQLLQDCVDDNSRQPPYSDEQYAQLPSESQPLSCQPIVSDNEDDDLEQTSKYKGKKRKRFIEETDSEEDEAVGQWVICKFEFGTKINYYLGQEVVGSNCPEKQMFQFYRAYMSGVRVYIKLPTTEVHNKNHIVSYLPRNVIDIVGGDKIKIKGQHVLEYKCV